MNKCLLCNTSFKVRIDYQNLFSLKPLKTQKVCNLCISKFQPLANNQCKNCSKELDKVQEICQDCQFWKKQYSNLLLKNKSLYRYNEIFHDLMVRYKRYGDYVMHEVFGDLIDKLPKADYYVPIATSPSHYQKRGFDTVEAIFSELINLTPALEKNDQESAQGEKNRQQRLESKQTFLAKKNLKLRGKILLLDDIYTTGRTLYHARDALIKEYPNLKIESFSIAR